MISITVPSIRKQLQYSVNFKLKNEMTGDDNYYETERIWHYHSRHEKLINGLPSNLRRIYQIVRDNPIGKVANRQSLFSKLAVLAVGISEKIHS